MMTEEQLNHMANQQNMPAHPQDCETVIELLRRNGIIAEWHERAQKLIRDARWKRAKGMPKTI